MLCCVYSNPTNFRSSDNTELFSFRCLISLCHADFNGVLADKFFVYSLAESFISTERSGYPSYLLIYKTLPNHKHNKLPLGNNNSDRMYKLSFSSVLNCTMSPHWLHDFTTSFLYLTFVSCNAIFKT